MPKRFLNRVDVLLLNRNEMKNYYILNEIETKTYLFSTLVARDGA